MDTKILIIAVVVVIVVIGAVILVLPTGTEPGVTPPGPVACTDEAKICPDGSAVVRVGPDCEFAPCPEAAYTDISPAEAKALIDSTPDLVVIDVSPHYDNGHLPGAVHYYLGDGSLDAAIPTLDKSKPYLVYCHIDSVAIAGAQKLIDAGFTTVYRLEGNYAAWVDAGYQIEPMSEEGCNTNADCDTDEFCKKATGDCDRSGECEIMPEICTLDYTPVCGCDGKTYGNACGAEGAGVNIAYEGECEISGEECEDIPWDLICIAPATDGGICPNPFHLLSACEFEYGLPSFDITLLCDEYEESGVVQVDCTCMYNCEAGLMPVPISVEITSEQGEISVELEEGALEVDEMTISLIEDLMGLED